MSESLKDKKIRVLEAAEMAVDELINVLKEKIITHGEDDLSADKMKNAASAKRLAFDDAIAMLQKIDDERGKLEEKPVAEVNSGKFGFAEGRASKNGRK